jgi:ribosomal protein S18 acetylase RimI-like enzyme
MRAAESSAVERARTLLVLDTAVEGGASWLYEKLGFVLAGTIPDYALKPHGGLTGTKIYWKRIGGKPEKAASNARNIPQSTPR